MPVQIVGSDVGEERVAAECLKRILEPHLSSIAELMIIVGARPLGENVEDIDLLLLGTFGRGVNFKGRLADTTGRNVRLVNLALIVEVKGHTGPKVNFDAQHVKVLYSKGWEDVTNKVFIQSRVLPEFLRRYGQPVPRFSSLIWLQNYTGTIPTSAVNVLGATFTADDFFAAVERVRRPQQDGGDFYIAFTKNQDITTIQKVRGFFHQRIPPTKLDRKRLERICKRLISEQKYGDRLGTQLLVFRGRGGSGKTIHLLRLAKDLYDDGNRVLFLTFNKALVSDIRRLLVILDISSHGFDRSVHISTAHSFFIEMMGAWGYWPPEARKRNGEFPAALYQSKKNELLQLTAGENSESIRHDPIFKNAPHVFGWDYVFVDEGQDWPEDERDLLFTSFGFDHCVIADGVDQFIRDDISCDWTTPAPKKQIVPLRRALRMESSLCYFIRGFADEAGAVWDQEVNEEIKGGQITIIDGPYTRKCHEEIFQQHREDGNEPVDALFCVPPAHKTQPPMLADTLREWGYSVWDGTSKMFATRFLLRMGSIAL